MIPRHGACCAHAEFVFKVSDDFSNFIEIFTAAVEIAIDFIIKYGRWRDLSTLFHACSLAHGISGHDACAAELRATHHALYDAITTVSARNSAVLSLCIAGCKSTMMSCFALSAWSAGSFSRPWGPVQHHVGPPCSNPLNTALEWRFTGGSSVTLEGNRGSQDDIFCWIEVLGSVWTPHWDEFVRAVFDAWTAIEPDLKPHWYARRSSDQPFECCQASRQGRGQH